MVYIRNKLNAQGITVRAVLLLDHESEHIVEGALHLLVSLLEDGHRPSQDAVFEYFKSTAEEQFFIIIRTRLLESTVIIKETRVLAAMKEARFAKEKELAAATQKSRTQKRTEGSLNAPLIKKVNADGVEMIEIAEDDEEGDVENEILSFSQVVGLVRPILRMLQLLCENHNMTLRDYLREQPDNLKSYNLIKEVANYLGEVYQNTDSESIEVVIQVIETLNEFAMGNVENEMVLFDSKAMDVVNHLLRQPKANFHDCSAESVADLKLKSLILIKTMLEDNGTVAQNLAKQIISILDLETVYENMLIYDSDEPIDDDYKFSDVGYICANVLARLNDLLRLNPALTEREKKNLEKRMELHLFDEDPDKVKALYAKYEGKGYENATEVSEKVSKSFETIEIVVDGELQKVYFRVAHREALTQRIRDGIKKNKQKNALSYKVLLFFSFFFFSFCPLDVLFTVNRDSPTERIRSFVDLGLVLQDRLKFLATLQGNILTRTIVNNHFFIHSSMLIWVLVVNIFMLSTWQANGNYQNPIPDVEDWYYPVIWALGAVHVFLAALVVFGHFLTDPPIQFGFKGEEDIDDAPKDFDDDEDSDLLQLERKDMTLNDHAPTHAKKKKKVDVKKLQILKRIGDALTFTMGYLRFADLYHLVFLAMSILGFFFSGYTYCFHLLHIVVANDILLRVLQSVTKNGTALIWVAALGVVIIYIYSVVGFALYRGSFDYQSDLWCDSLFECFLTSLNAGLRAGGGLGDVLVSDNFIWAHVGLKIFYDLSFFVIISTIGLNIIFGIIVDTFSELRDERYRIVDDMQSVCFICSLPSYDFDRNAAGFVHHIKKEHNMWGYLLFAIYLNEKNPSEYTAFEAYVADRINRNELGWFPINRAMALSQEDRTIEDELKRIWNTLDYLVTRHKEDDIRKVVEGNKTSQQKWKEEALTEHLKKEEEEEEEEQEEE